MAKAKVAKRKIKKKIWFQILAPQLFNNQIMGETLASEPDELIGKLIPINLMSLTNDMRKQNIKMKFRINKVVGEKANTEIIGFEMIPSGIKRLVRRSKRKMDESLVVETADNIKLRVKLIMITLNFTSKPVVADIRKALRERLDKTVKKMKYEEFISETVEHKIQNIIKKQISKIYPVKICEIRHISIEKGRKVPEEKAKDIE